jgi:hypothetical protein
MNLRGAQIIDGRLSPSNYTAIQSAAATADAIGRNSCDAVSHVLGDVIDDTAARKIKTIV